MGQQSVVLLDALFPGQVALGQELGLADLHDLIEVLLQGFREEREGDRHVVLEGAGQGYLFMSRWHFSR